MDDSLNHKIVCQWYQYQKFMKLCGRIIAEEVTERIANGEMEGRTVDIDEGYFGKKRKHP